ncbi:MAG TPA: glycosyltransferase family 87 protein [Gemmatimonadales bacterium]|nr:glycosyltransferase family 87 protein [Gemmatimonadales bacterium]
MPESRRSSVALAVLACLYAGAVIPLAIHKGGDFTSELGQSERLLHGLPPFGAADPNLGVPWPPFSAMALIPFALIARCSLALAKGLWAAAGVACVWWCLRRAARRGTRPALLALAAVLVPLQTNFEHLNIAAILLALVVLAIDDLEAGNETRAGVAIGLAAALKAFPGLLLVYFAVQRRWRALAVGALVAVSLTLIALLPLGAGGAITGVVDWMTLGLEHRWATQPTADQSLAALAFRLGIPTVLGSVIGAVALVVTLAVAARRRRSATEILLGAGACTLLAVLLSPIAWVHSLVLLYPAWLGVLAAGPVGSTQRLVLIAAGVGTSGLLTVGPRAWRSGLLAHSAYTWSAMLLWIVVIFLLWQHRTPRPQEQTS